jgi:hypothetical protein
MNDPDPDHSIQPASGSAPGVPLSSISETETQFPKPSSGIFPRGLIFGAFVGFLMGVPTALACCWILGLYESQVPAAFAGAMFGTLTGAVIGVMERKARGDLIRPDIATIICFIFGLVPAALMLLQGIGAVRGRFSIYALLGAAFTGPMVAMLVGGLLDRAYEASHKRSLGSALGFAIFGLAALAGLSFLLHRMMQGPDADELAPQVKALLVREWRKRPDLESLKIRKVSLVHEGGREYSGAVDATNLDLVEKFTIHVVVDREGFTVTWEKVRK